MYGGTSGGNEFSSALKDCVISHTMRGSISNGVTHVRILVVGDHASGKTSLITAFASETFPEKVPSVLPATQLSLTDNDSLTIVDTSSSLESRGKIIEEAKRADIVMFTYAWDQTSTLSSLTNFWIPEFRRLKIKVPVIVVGCKLDKRGDEMNLEKLVGSISRTYREIEKCTECSAAKLAHVPEVFYYAQQAAIFPSVPLFDNQSDTLKPRCVSALSRIFVLCDHDMDGVLNSKEFIQYQKKSINRLMQRSECKTYVGKLRRLAPYGVHVSKVKVELPGFLFLHQYFIRRRRIDITWTTLRSFGYNNELELNDDYTLLPFKRAPDQTLELTNEAVDLLKGVFSKFDTDKDEVLCDSDLFHLFSTAPESPWSKPPYSDYMRGKLSLSDFLSKWALMTLLEPARSLAYLMYIGYNSGAASAFRLTRRRSVDREKQQTDRNVYQCFVFGSTGSGKSALLKSLIGWYFFTLHNPTRGKHSVANVVDRPGGTQKILVLSEIIEEKVGMLLSNNEFLAVCDVAVFLYDKSDENSLKRASELLMTVARLGEISGFMVPCLFIAAKDDLNPYPTAIQDSAEICQNVGIDAPIHISVKNKELNNVFNRIVTAAEHPHLCLPETEVGRSQRQVKQEGRASRIKQYRPLVTSSLILTSVVAAVAVVGLAAYRSYAARKSTSS